MQVHSVLFTDTPHGANYERMAQVLSHTIAANSPNTPLALHRVTEPDEDLIAAMNQRPNKGTRKQLYLDNARKTKHHCQIVRDARDGEVLCLMDSDAMVLGDLSPLTEVRTLYLQQIPELILTARPHGCRYFVNTGVVVVKVTDFTRSFFGKWLEIVTEMLRDMPLHLKWKESFGGINQSALAKLDHDHPGACVEHVSCTIWNCEHDCLKRELFSDETKVVHANGNLRRVLFHGEHPQNKTIVRVADIWRQFEREAKGVAA